MHELNPYRDYVYESDVTSYCKAFCPPAQIPPDQSLAVPSGAALVGIHAFADFLALSRDTVVTALEAGNYSGDMDARIAAMTELAKVTSAFELLSRFHMSLCGGLAQVSTAAELVTTPCLFPQPEHDSDPHSWATGQRVAFSELRDDFHTQAVCYGVNGLDATEDLPRGSVFSVASRRSSWGNCSDKRGAL